MLYEHQKRSGSLSVESIAISMSECAQVDMDFADSLKVLQKMIDEGSRMANLEKVLGQGAKFLLCHDGADAL